MVLVTGTGTEVGKTWVACSLLSMARERGLVVAARKPLQSFGAADRETDGSRLAAASGETAAAVCPPERSYPVPMAPPMAAAELGRTVPSLAELAAEIGASWPSGHCDLGLVEGAGGVASPLCDDGDSADLGRLLGVDRAVLVADAELGVISAVRLGVRALAPIPVVVHLNRFSADRPLHALNAAWLRDRDGFAVTTTVEGVLAALVGPIA